MRSKDLPKGKDKFKLLEKVKPQEEKAVKIIFLRQILNGITSIAII